ncbi:flagellar motor protein MotA [Paramagnetospirillum marisnigri]|uniref:Flagellar motor protein MotA n=1 Tax=Paramagnetospirillum marisnigri TaxID=1285242 RepID=A0A178M911_9PROT|nr:MotA/TolQ/ExbB proton channel family protein [Paramagnetospirillum marisnigri]OAN44707.1 flagellar motor protein MotA [Paramagnetospirillum marisnigri]
MSLPTIIGFSLSLFLLLGSILELTTNFKIFLHLSGILMVVGGTLAATLVAYEARYVKAALGKVRGIFSSPKMTRDMLTNEVARIVRWAYLMQKSGISALETDAKSVKNQDSFLGFGINLVISGYTGPEVRHMLENQIETTFQRNTVPVEILKYMASNAPAFGMIATLIGLVVMLDSMGSDPSKLGAGMAVGLLGTLYGVLFARLAIMPSAEKTHQRESIVRFRNLLVAEGLSLLADRRNPRFIQDAMNSYLDPSIHFDIDKAPKK